MAGLTYLGRLCAVLVGPPQFFSVKTDDFFLVVIVSISIYTFIHSSVTIFSHLLVLGPAVHVHIG